MTPWCADQIGRWWRSNCQVIIQNCTGLRGHIIQMHGTPWWYNSKSVTSSPGNSVSLAFKTSPTLFDRFHIPPESLIITVPIYIPPESHNYAWFPTTKYFQPSPTIPIRHQIRHGLCDSVVCRPNRWLVAVQLSCDNSKLCGTPWSYNSNARDSVVV